MKKYNGFLFDLDGTLIDTTDLIVASFKHTLKWGCDFEISTDKIKELIGRPLYDQFRIYLDNREDIDYESFMEEHMRYQIENWEKYVTVFKGMKEILDILKNNQKKMGIVTSRKNLTAAMYTKRLGIYSYFQSLVTPELTEKHKPQADPALYAMKELGLLKDETLFIGDTTFDIECANNAGIDSVFVSWGAGKREDVHGKATHIIENMSDLKRFVLDVKN